MKNKTLLYTLLFAVMGAFGILSNILSTVAYGSFAFFEVFYFLCILLSPVLLFSAEKKQLHLPAAILLPTLGFFVNCFIWSIRMASGIGQVLNLVLTALIFASGLSFLHMYLGAKNGKKVLFVLSLLFAALTVVVAVYNLVMGVSGDNTPFYNLCIVMQNLSLLSTLALPASYLLYMKENDAVRF